MKQLLTRLGALFHLARSCSAAPLPPSQARDEEVRRSSQIPCNDLGSDWQPTLSAFSDADTLSQLTEWNDDRNTGVRFDQALGDEFGDDNFVCGIGQTQCIVAGTCFGFETANVSAWVYQAAVSAQNFNNLLDNIYTGISLAQEDATELTPSLADQVFKWKDQNLILEDILSWIGFALTIVFAIGAPEIAAAVEAGTVDPLALSAFTSIGSAASAIPNQLISQISLPPGTPREVGIDKLNSIFYSTSTSTRAAWLTYANNIFSGAPDANNKTIIDIIGHGAYVTQKNIATLQQIENFYKSFLVAKSINAYWQQRNVYVISTTANLNESSIDYPLNTAWYSSTTGRTYIPYSFNGEVPTEPPGLSALNGSFYGIYGHQVAQSIGRAFEVAAFNYTPAVAAQRIQAAFGSQGQLQPFQDGAGWEGVFIAGVCDIQDHEEWVVPYGSKLLPCCCGVNCNDTRAFVESVGLNHSYAWLHTCRSQLKGTNLDASTIDFGIDPPKRITWWWHSLSEGDQAGFVVCAVFLLVAIILALAACCGLGACGAVSACIIGAGCIAGIVYLIIKR